MKKLTIIVLSIFFSTNVFSQKIYTAQSDVLDNFAMRISKNDLEDHIKTLCSPEFEGRRTGTAGNNKAMKYVISQFKKHDILPTNSIWYEQYFIEYGIRGINVIGMIEGTEYPDESIVITAHYDALGMVDGVMYPGADDNASGVAALIEIADAFSAAQKAGYKPKRSIIFAAFDGGKQKSIGAQHYSKFPVKPLSKIKMLLNMDMMGRDDCGPNRNEKNYVFLLDVDEVPKQTQQICDSINNIKTHLHLEYSFYNNKELHKLFYPTSDQYPFANIVPTIFFTGGVNTDVQMPTDTPDKISLSTLRIRTQLVFYTAWHFANN